MVIKGVFPKRSLQTLQCTPHQTPFCHIFHSNFLCDVVLVLGGHQEVSDGVASFEVNLNANFATYVFETFTQSFGVGHHCMDAVVLVVVV